MVIRGMDTIEMSIQFRNLPLTAYLEFFQLQQQQHNMSTIHITSDGKLTKRIITEGTNDSVPKPGNTVTVEYTGSLQNGKVFDSTKNRGSFKFVLGAGRVIRGWDLGVATMKKGEKAEFTMSPEYGYGAHGAGNVIPPNASLTFEIELTK